MYPTLVFYKVGQDVITVGSGEELRGAGRRGAELRGVGSHWGNILGAGLQEVSVHLQWSRPQKVLGQEKKIFLGNHQQPLNKKIGLESWHMSNSTVHFQ